LTALLYADSIAVGGSHRDTSVRRVQHSGFRTAEGNPLFVAGGN
jgi:hypothetical protein